MRKSRKGVAVAVELVSRFRTVNPLAMLVLFGAILLFVAILLPALKAAR